MMPSENTVTISLDEYIDLRQKAEMNAFLLGQLNGVEMRFSKYDDMLFSLEDEVRRLRNGD